MAVPEPQSIGATTPASRLEATRGSEAPALAFAGSASVLGSLCCIGPPVTVTLGLGGGVASARVGPAPYRPFFVVLALAALAYSGWRIHRGPAAAC